MHPFMNEPWIFIDIDYSHCRYCDEVYVTTIRELELPDFCGHNLSAIWDGVTGMMALPADITVRGFSSIHPDARHTVIKIIDVFKDAEEEYGYVRLHVVD